MSSSTQFGVVLTVDGVSPVAGNIALTSTDASVTITPGVGTINFAAAGGGGGVTTIDGDVSFVTGATITLTGGTSGAVFTGNGATIMTQSFEYLSLPDSTSALLGVIDIGSTPFFHAYPGLASTNVFIGNAGNFTMTTASSATGIGPLALSALTTGDDNIAVGERCLELLQDGNANVAIGVATLSSNTSGAGNIGIGINALAFSATGSGNICIGYNAGSGYTGTDGHNICLGSAGIAGENNVMRLGVGYSLGDPTTTFIAGIAGNSPGGGDQIVYVNTTTGQMSSAAASGVTTIDGDSSFVTGATITLTGGSSGAIFTGNGTTTMTMSFNELNLPATISSSVGVINVSGTPFLHSYGATPGLNTFVGGNAGNFTLDPLATDNTGVGWYVLSGLTTGVGNTCIKGFQALTTGSYNTNCGEASYNNVVTGSRNIGLGWASGNNYTSSESDNILIGSAGVIGDNRVMRIGSGIDTGAGGADPLTTYMGGIAGNAPGGGDEIVYVNTTTGQLSSAAPSSSGITTIDGDVSFVTGATVTFSADLAGGVFTGDGATSMNLTFNALLMPTSTSTSTGAIYLGNSRFMHNYGLLANANTFLGTDAGNFTLDTSSAIHNTGLGSLSLNAITEGLNNTSLGYNSASLIDVGNGNVAVGAASLSTLASGDNNTAVGLNALDSVASGFNNIAIGFGAGSNYVTNESGNVLLGNDGVVGDGTTMRLGGTITSTYIAGIYGHSPSGTAQIAYVDTNGLMTSAPAGLIPPLSYTNVNSTPYVVLSTDEYISVDCSGAAITVELPNTTSTGRVFVIKDRTGSSATNTITVTTVGGVVNIDGSASFPIVTNYEAISVLFNGSSYEIY